MPDVYPLPPESPLEEIEPWIGHLLGAIDSELDTAAAWDDSDAPAALGFVEDLKVYVTELPDMRIPVGTIQLYAGQNAPAGWLLCQGQEVPRVEHPRLFAIIGTTYGAGDGSTTFNLPDMRGRAPVGTGLAPGTDAQGFEYTNRVLGEQLGSEQIYLSPANIPSMEPRLGVAIKTPDTRRNYPGLDAWDEVTGEELFPNYSTYYLSVERRKRVFAWTDENGNQFNNPIGNFRFGSLHWSPDYPDSDIPHENMPPSLVLNFIIRAR